MSYYKEGAQEFGKRASISVDNVGGAAGAIDITATIPAEWDDFWDVVDASGNELRVCGNTGTTKLTYALSGFNKTNRTGTIQVKSYNAPAGGMLQIFLYWAAPGAAAGSAVVALAAPKTGYIETCGPANGNIVRAGQPRPNDDRPPKQIAKGTDESRYLWFDIRNILAARLTPGNGKLLCDEISYASYTVTLAGVAQAGMIDATKTRFYDGFVKVLLKAGTTGVDYTVVPLLTTTEGEVLAPRAWLRVRDQKES